MSSVGAPLVAAIESCPIDEPSPQGVQFSGSRYLFRMAAQEFGVNLSEQEDNDWRALLGGAYFVDHLLDIDKDDVQSRVVALASGQLLDSLHENTQIRFREYLLRQAETRYEDIIRRLGQVSSLAHQQASAKSASDVITVRRQEADLLAYLLALPAEDRPDAEAREKFNDWLLGWSRAGYLLDSLVDMGLDYKNSDSGVEPTIRSRVSVGAAAIKETFIAARKTPPRLLGHCALVGFRYLLLNKKPDMTDLTREQ